MTRLRPTRRSTSSDVGVRSLLKEKARMVGLGYFTMPYGLKTCCSLSNSSYHAVSATTLDKHPQNLQAGKEFPSGELTNSKPSSPTSGTRSKTATTLLPFRPAQPMVRSPSRGSKRLAPAVVSSVTVRCPRIWCQGPYSKSPWVALLKTPSAGLFSFERYCKVHGASLC